MPVDSNYYMLLLSLIFTVHMSSAGFPSHSLSLLLMQTSNIARFTHIAADTVMKHSCRSILTIICFSYSLISQDIICPPLASLAIHSYYFASNQQFSKMHTYSRRLGHEALMPVNSRLLSALFPSIPHDIICPLLASLAIHYQCSVCKQQFSKIHTYSKRLGHEALMPVDSKLLSVSAFPPRSS